MIINDHKLEEGEVVCPRCKGKGWTAMWGVEYKETCDKCFGIGKLDWVENVVGKQEFFEDDYYTLRDGNYNE